MSDNVNEKSKDVLKPRNLKERRIKEIQHNLRKISDERDEKLKFLLSCLEPGSSTLKRDLIITDHFDFDPSRVPITEIVGKIVMYSDTVPEWLKKVRMTGSCNISSGCIMDLYGISDEIDGSLSIGLRDLSNCSRSVTKHFWCCHNQNLTSLNGGPKYVGGHYHIRQNNITSLEHLNGVKIGRDLDCSGNRLTSLEGCPEHINGNFNCSYNFLESLDYFPRVVEGDFYCFGNKVPTELKVPEGCKVKGQIKFLS